LGGGGLNFRLTTLLCKKIILAKTNDVKTGWSNSHKEQTNLAKFSKGGYGSKRALLPMMMICYTGWYSY
jgi:hypothetical protein